MRVQREQVAVVTGAASGIGQALAAVLAARGMRVAMLDVHADRLAEQAAALVIANAGIGTYGRFDEVPEAHFDAVLRVNLHGVIHTTRAWWPQLLAQPSAHLVTISSVFGLVAPAGQSAYAAAKFGVRGFTEALRHEAEGSSVRVSVVHPGGVRTRIAEHASYDATRFTAAERDAKIAHFARLARTAPATAAARILRGIERDEPRILVGPDATVLAWLARLWPVGYWRLMRRMLMDI